MEQNKYIGITIGPIGATMDLTSSPAGLWAASYLFSKLAHDIRQNINKEGLLQDKLKFSGDKDVSSIFDIGVGLYHDRVIYKAEGGYSLEQANSAVQKAVRTIVNGFAKSKIYSGKIDELEEFFYSYFNIHIVSVEVGPEDNFLFVVNDALDAAELEVNFASSIKFNPILELFDGNDKGRNEEIKNSFLVPKNPTTKQVDRNWVLLERSGKGIKDLSAIAIEGMGVQRIDLNKNGLRWPKTSVYYAVIRADGDNMGQTIKETITGEESYIEFSKKCFRYGCNTAEVVLRYGGIPIYIGGDDLLCIAPLMCRFGDREHTFLEMIKEIRGEFRKEFKEGPDLSFGVAIQYVKAPLYEALSESGRLLFDTAKKNKPGAMAINLRKHSGQSTEILIKNLGNIETGEKERYALDSLIHNHISKDTLKSVGKHVAEFSALLNQAVREGTNSVDNYFNNVFDNGVSDSDWKYLEQIKGLTVLLNQCDRDNEISRLLGSYIRFIQFFSETVDGEERTL